MKKWKISGLLICVILLFMPLLMVPICRAELVSLWGVSSGTVKTYTYTTTYNGSVENSATYGNYVFAIINVWDNDDNNYTELLYTRERVIDGTPDLDLLLLEDDEGDWDYDDLVTTVVDDATGEIYPLIPTQYVGTDSVGMNWTVELQYINNTMENYTVTINGDIVTIFHWEFGEEVFTEVSFEINEYIKWDNSTGWLVSYERITKYGDPANYDAKVSITVKSGGGGLSFDLNLLLGIIGIATGAAGIGLGLLAYKKSKEQQ